MKCDLKVKVNKGPRQQWEEMLGKSIMVEKYVGEASKKPMGGTKSTGSLGKRPGE